MENAQLPVDLFRWSLALLPIAVLLILMVVLSWKAPDAGPMGMFTAAAVGLFAFATPWERRTRWQKRSRRIPVRSGATCRGSRD